MLTLSRKVAERIIINDDLVITVVKLNGNKVRIGFEADFEKYNIDREEIYVKKVQTKLISELEKLKKN